MKDYFTKLLKLFLYAGLEKEEYQKLRPSIHKENCVLLGVFSLIAAAMFFLLLIASLISRGFATVNSPTYLTCGIVMLAILLCLRYAVPKNSVYIMLLVLLFEITLYVFGIHISMLHADKAAVSAVVFLLVTPLLFYDRPIRLTLLIAVVAAIFCGIVVSYKDPSVAESDVWNVITFGIVAISTTLFIMSIKMKALAQSSQIEYMSQTDLLTGVKNRNHYENSLQGYPERCTSKLVCIYADVNGLHETNNKEGHAAGDKMLRTVASEMQQCFGTEHTYRIGGDEFAAFRMDCPPEEVLSEIDQIRKELAKAGYYVSFGLAVQDKAQGELDMNELVKEAEENMYDAKREFYRQPEHNRRNR